MISDARNTASLGKYDKVVKVKTSTSSDSFYITSELHIKLNTQEKAKLNNI